MHSVNFQLDKTFLQIRNLSVIRCNHYGTTLTKQHIQNRKYRYIHQHHQEDDVYHANISKLFRFKQKMKERKKIYLVNEYSTIIIIGCL